jgi:hypothetical protein
MLWLVASPQIGTTCKSIEKEKESSMKKFSFVLSLVLTASAFAQSHSDDAVTFNMAVSTGAATCLPNASATVRVTPNGPNQDLEVSVRGLRPDTTYNLFVLQLPRTPFGVAWYQGDIQTNHLGTGRSRFTGIFSDETFTHAQGSGAAPVLHTGAFPDASVNPIFAPVHMFHLGIWFDSFADAMAAGCPATITAFSGDHTAGIQVLNTGTFANDQGPLRQVNFPASERKREDNR